MAASFALIVRAKNLSDAAQHHTGYHLSTKVGGIVRLTRFILRGTFLIELLGALAMPVFCRDYGLRGVWMAMFHSISAFVMPDLTFWEKKQSLSIPHWLRRLSGNQYHNYAADRDRVASAFLTWDDICETNGSFIAYRMQSKVIPCHDMSSY